MAEREDGRKYYRMARGRWRRVEGPKTIREYVRGDLVRLNAKELASIAALVDPTLVSDAAAKAELDAMLRPRAKRAEPEAAEAAKPAEPTASRRSWDPLSRPKSTRGERG